MSTIELRNLTKTGPKDALLLDKISLTIPEGTSLAIVGPPNAGKSLLLRILVGLEEPSDGELMIGESLVNAVGPRDRDFAMVFQDFEVYPHLDVFDNIAFSAKLRKGYKKSELADRILDIADLLGLGERLDAKPVDLTESERQRVALGRVLVRDATAYLFDDPFSKLDERARSQVRSMTLQWQRELGRTSVYVTNDISEALSLGDEVAVLHQGFVHQCASPRELYDHPVDMFVASFVGSPPMNLIPAQVRGGSLQLPFTTLPLGDEMRDRIGDQDLVIVGIRAEDCTNASSRDPESLKGAISFSTKVDEVEWRSSSQYAYLGFDIDEDTEVQLHEIEDHIEFDLFQSHLVASVSVDSKLKAGTFIRLAVDSAKVHVFDATSGANLMLRYDN